MKIEVPWHRSKFENFKIQDGGRQPTWKSYIKKSHPGKWWILTPYRIETHGPTAIIFGTFVVFFRERIPWTKFGTNPSTRGFWANGWNITFCAFYIYLYFLCVCRVRLGATDVFVVFFSDCPINVTINPECLVGESLKCSARSYPEPYYFWIDHLHNDTVIFGSEILLTEPGPFHYTCVAYNNVTCEMNKTRPYCQERSSLWFDEYQSDIDFPYSLFNESTISFLYGYIVENCTDKMSIYGIAFGKLTYCVIIKNFRNNFAALFVDLLHLVRVLVLQL